MTIAFYLILTAVAVMALKNMMPAAGVRQVTAAELKKDTGKKEKQWIDVRTPGEFKAGHIAGFKNIPLHQLSARLKELDPQQEVVVVCQSGMRSQKAARLLKKKGFKYIANVAGGIGAWK